ncbi:hypothetical protein JMN32_23200 [Fulvivirga sp. 29W222]|uniref:Uncharacterized protein n=1 Tax=Fulvivirga marina TaxID=2494733 RepID=A0A937KDK7_9BACT|nr:hypothetical protein [Fulvivirga marina]MBL6449236.1 hypothetical protein [Fulvivirga marina]
MKPRGYGEVKWQFYLGLFWMVLIPPILHAQDDSYRPPKTSLNGYLKFLQTVQFEDVDGNWTTDNIIHNRLNFKWFLSPSLKFVTEARTRLFYGETVETYPQYSDLVNRDVGYFDFSAIVVEGGAYFIHTTMDRLYLDWSVDNWQVRAGRQRINWGQCFVWNPNDIFNAYSFFDFDYEERPGSDAVLVRYYTGTTSSVEFATSFADSFDKFKMTAMYRWNVYDYDFQVIAGKVEQDMALGVGWSGQIKDAGFKGEATWLEPEHKSESERAVVITVSSDYTFKNSFFIHSEAIYNSFGNKAAGDLGFFSESRTPKTLTATEWSWFNEISYQVSPLVKAGVSSIYNPEVRSVFLGPNAEISLSDNLYVLFFGQFFFGPDESQYDELGFLNYLRLKWSF